MTWSNSWSRLVVLRTILFTSTIHLFQAGMRNCVGPIRPINFAILVLLTGRGLTEPEPMKSPCIRAIGFGLAQSMRAWRATSQCTQLSRYLLQPRYMLRWRRLAFVLQILL